MRSFQNIHDTRHMFVIMNSDLWSNSKSASRRCGRRAACENAGVFRAAIDWRHQARGGATGLSAHIAVGVARYFDEATCARWAKGVYAAKNEWTSDFEGEQFTLGRAFYT